MNYDELTREGALEKGISSREPWENDEWDYPEPMWKRAFKFAEKYHTQANFTYVNKSKEMCNGTVLPYIDFIRSVLEVLMNELNIHDYMVLTITSLYHFPVPLESGKELIAKEFTEDIAEFVFELMDLNLGGKTLNIIKKFKLS